MKRRETVIVLCIIAVLTVFFGSKYISINKSTEENSFEKVESTEEISASERNDDTDSEEIYVHVCGRVKNPGLIKLENGARVADAVEMAGGLYEDADIDRVNLAKKLSDEERVYIPEAGDESAELPTGSEDKDCAYININTATKEELQNLPGIGPKTADKIIEYRENKNFDKVDDIKGVPGIGDKKFAEIEKFISVN